MSADVYTPRATRLEPYKTVVTQKAGGNTYEAIPRTVFNPVRLGFRGAQNSIRPLTGADSWWVGQDFRGASSQWEVRQIIAEQNYKEANPVGYFFLPGRSDVAVSTA